VNATTGAIQLTGLFPNPGNTLRPGQYARVRASVGTHAGALLVPQRSVTETQGNYLVAVVNPNDTIRFAPVKVGDRIGSKWVIEDGLKPGERVVTDGLFHIQPGAPVVPKPAGALSQRNAEAK
jgi:membrane fusion protein (multidrug efflux system)